jgi:hypothetical protein
MAVRDMTPDVGAQIEDSTPIIRALLQQALAAEPRVVDVAAERRTRFRRIAAAGRGCPNSIRHFIRSAGGILKSTSRRSPFLAGRSR